MELQSEPLAIRRRSPAPAVVVASQVYQIVAPEAEPRHILEAIVWHKEQEVERQREQLPLKELQRQLEQAPPCGISWPLSPNPPPRLSHR